VGPEKNRRPVMPDDHDGQQLEIWTPATYRIEFEGEGGENFSDLLGGMRVTNIRKEGNPKTINPHKKGEKQWLYMKKTKSKTAYWMMCMHLRTCPS
jgi:hypothetical protein